MEDSNKWYNCKSDEISKKIDGLVTHLHLKQSYRTEANLRNVRLYGNIEVLGLRIGEFSTVSNLNRLTLNVVQSAIDTATSRIAKSKPKPTFLTDGGDWSMQTKAKNLEKFMSGSFYNMDIYEKGQKVFRDGCIMGDGFLHFFADSEKKEIQCERVFPEEILIDEDEAMYGEESLKTMHRIKYVSKSTLKAQFPKMKAQIQAAPSAKEHGESYLHSQYSTDIVRVVESWRLREGKTLGKHTICLKNVTLFEEKYDKDYFPFERWFWNERVLGYWSQGIAEQLTGIQIEINKLLKTIQLTMHLGCVPKIFLEDGSKVVQSHLNNKIGSIIKYRGTRPTEGQLMSVPPELFLQLDRLYQKAFEIIGISLMSAQSQKPADLSSGKALRTFHDIESGRFAVVSQRWENFYMRCAKKVIKMTKDMAQDGDAPKIKAVDSRYMKTISWDEVDLPEDSYIMKVYPTNLLADDPSGRLSDITDMMDKGLLNVRQAQSLLDYPDLESVLSFENSIVEDIKATIEDIVDNGILNAPEPVQDLEYAIPVMQSAYLKYKRSSLPTERLDLFLTWIAQAVEILAPEEEEEAELPPEAMEEVEAELDVDPEMEIEQALEQGLTPEQMKQAI